MGSGLEEDAARDAVVLGRDGGWVLGQVEIEGGGMGRFKEGVEARRQGGGRVGPRGRGFGDGEGIWSGTWETGGVGRRGEEGG